jgi:hypothetical protein
MTGSCFWWHVASGRGIKAPFRVGRINAQAIAYTQAALSAGARVIMAGGSSTSMLSPQLFRDFSVPYLRQLCDAVHTMGGYVISHHHGRCRGILEDIASYGTDVVEPLEAPPLGDVNPGRGQATNRPQMLPEGQRGYR